MRLRMRRRQAAGGRDLRPLHRRFLLGGQGLTVRVRRLFGRASGSLLLSGGSPPPDLQPHSGRRLGVGFRRGLAPRRRPIVPGRQSGESRPWSIAKDDGTLHPDEELTSEAPGPAPAQEEQIPRTRAQGYPAIVLHPGTRHGRKPRARRAGCNGPLPREGIPLSRFGGPSYRDDGPEEGRRLRRRPPRLHGRATAHPHRVPKSLRRVRQASGPP